MSFGLSRPQAIALALDIQRIVKANWEGVLKNNNITGAELERLRTCFIASDEPIQPFEGEAI